MTRSTPSTRDPATSYDVSAWMLLSLANDGLTAFRRTGGRAGAQVVPDLAQSLPTPSDGGRTYTFALRPGVRFSTGRAVRPSDVKRGIERSLHAEQAAFGLLDGIASITADDASRTIVIRLERPDPDFLYRLALPFAAAVPPGVRKPLDDRAGHRAVPDRGAATAGTYGWSATPTSGSGRRSRSRTAIRTSSRPRSTSAAGEAVDGDPRGPQATSRRSTSSDATDDQRPAAARAGARARGRRSCSPPGCSSTRACRRSTALDARRAFSLAIDRRAAVAAFGGANAARQTCRILPPASSGYRPDCPARDLGKARALVRRSGTRGARVTLWSGKPGFSGLNPVITEALRAIGYRTRVHELPMERYFR